MGVLEIVIFYTGVIIMLDAMDTMVIIPKNCD